MPVFLLFFSLSSSSIRQFTWRLNYFLSVKFLNSVSFEIYMSVLHFFSSYCLMYFAPSLFRSKFNLSIFFFFFLLLYYFFFCNYTVDLKLLSQRSTILEVFNLICLFSFVFFFQVTTFIFRCILYTLLYAFN